MGIDDKKIIYFPNSTENFYKPMIKDIEIDKTLPKGFKLLFAGNIGEAQSFDTLIDAAYKVKNKGFKLSWIILGDGRKKDYAMKIIQSNQIHSRLVV